MFHPSKALRLPAVGMVLAGLGHLRQCIQHGMGLQWAFPSVCDLSRMINYNGKRFRPVQNTANGETSAETIFHYRQEGNVLTSTYSGGRIVSGHLIALVDEEGCIDMRYHQVNDRGELMTGTCRSLPELLPEGRIRLHESWQWTSGDRSSGSSVLEEI